MNTRRLDGLERDLKGIRPTQQAVEAATKQFERKGDLPADTMLTLAVIEGILARKSPDFRRQLLCEATDGLDFVREPARLVLRLLVSAGMDINDPQLIPYDMPPPEFGTLGLHLLGWPECVAKPPYEAQAGRLFTRLDALRRRGRNRDREWFEDLARSLGEFLRQGSLPDNELLRDVVLAEGEMFALMANLGGEGDAEVLAAFDAIALTEGAEWADAVAQLQELVRAGRMYNGGE